MKQCKPRSASWLGFTLQFHHYILHITRTPDGPVQVLGLIRRSWDNYSSQCVQYTSNSYTQCTVNPMCTVHTKIHIHCVQGVPVCAHFLSNHTFLPSIKIRQRSVCVMFVLRHFSQGYIFFSCSTQLSTKFILQNSYTLYTGDSNVYSTHQNSYTSCSGDFNVYIIHQNSYTLCTGDSNVYSTHQNSYTPCTGDSNVYSTHQNSYTLCTVNSNVCAFS